MEEKQSSIHTPTTSSSDTDQDIFKTITVLKQAIYKKHVFRAIVPKKCAHLTTTQQNKLISILDTHTTIFEGKKGQWTGSEVHVKLKPDANPIRCKPYPIPLKNQEATKHKVFRQCDISTLMQLSGKKQEEQNWASSAFGVPKKDGTIGL